MEHRTNSSILRVVNCFDIMDGVGMEEFMAQASDSGMYCVNSADNSAIFAEFTETSEKAEELCAIIDPVETPYKSKYDARSLIDATVNKMDATRTIASLEKNRATMQQMDWRLASLRVKLGSISWDVEEPHNAQTELELACNYYFPELAETINKTLTEDDVTDSGEAKDVNTDYSGFDMDSLLLQVNSAMGAAVVQAAPPGECPRTCLAVLQNLKHAECIDALKCLNLLGILWAGRMHIKRAFCYLLSVKESYEVLKFKCKAEIKKNNDAFQQLKNKPIINTLAELESTLTHNLFYLAQAYGHVGNTKQSSLCCYHTLRRQLTAGLTTNEAVMEWCVNCSGLADFFIAIGESKQAAYVLSMSEKILKEKYVLDASLGGDYCEKYTEITARLNRRWAKLDFVVLKTSLSYHDQWETYDTILKSKAMLATSNSSSASSDEAVASAPMAGGKTSADLVESVRSHTAAVAAAAASASVAEGMPPQPPSDHISKSTGDGAAVVVAPAVAPAVTKSPAAAAPIGEEGLDYQKFQPFPGVTVPEVPYYTQDLTDYSVTAAEAAFNNPVLITTTDSSGVTTSKSTVIHNVCNYDDARQVFLRAQARLELAKKYYVLDGYVTDHVNLLIQHSQLFLSLAHIDTDVKRKLAMQLRRGELLMPLLKTLSRASYEELHKQLSYECGEIYMSCLDLKLEKVMNKFNKNRTNPVGAVSNMHDLDSTGADIMQNSNMKASEITSINDYCLKALICFAYFSQFFEQRKEANAKEETASDTITNLTGLNMNQQPIKADSAQNMKFEELLNCKDFKKVAAASCIKPDMSKCSSSVACFLYFPYF